MSEYSEISAWLLGSLAMQFDHPDHEKIVEELAHRNTEVLQLAAEVLNVTLCDKPTQKTISRRLISNLQDAVK